MAATNGCLTRLTHTAGPYEHVFKSRPRLRQTCPLPHSSQRPRLIMFLTLCESHFSTMTVKTCVQRLTAVQLGGQTGHDHE